MFAARLHHSLWREYLQDVNSLEYRRDDLNSFTSVPQLTMCEFAPGTRGRCSSPLKLISESGGLAWGCAGARSSVASSLETTMSPRQTARLSNCASFLAWPAASFTLSSVSVLKISGQLPWPSTVQAVRLLWLCLLLVSSSLPTPSPSAGARPLPPAAA